MGYDPATKIVQKAGADMSVYLHGKLDRFNILPLWFELTESLKSTRPSQLILDFQEVTGIDTAGAAFLRELENLCAGQGTKISYLNLSETISPFLQYIEEHSSGQRFLPAEERPNLISRLGDWVWDNLQDAKSFLRFFGDFLISGPRQFLYPRRTLFGELFFQIQLAGAGATPLVIALSLLLGALMVFQGMNTVSNFGAPIYIADMVVFAVTREMAPLLTAMILAGRSGAAFAAEIGTMKLNEEIDALTVHNFEIVSYLVLPRIFALMVAGPLLTMISDATGILGGMLASQAALNLTTASFLHEAQIVFRANDIYSGLIKGAVFGTFIGLIGCFRGLGTDLGAGSVGIQTTSAVVTGIFMVIFLDTLFSFIFQMFGW